MSNFYLPKASGSGTPNAAEFQLPNVIQRNGISQSPNSAAFPSLHYSPQFAFGPGVCLDAALIRETYQLPVYRYPIPSNVVQPPAAMIQNQPNSMKHASLGPNLFVGSPVVAPSPHWSTPHMIPYAPAAAHMLSTNVNEFGPLYETTRPVAFAKQQPLAGAQQLLLEQQKREQQTKLDRNPLPIVDPNTQRNVLVANESKSPSPTAAAVITTPNQQQIENNNVGDADRAWRLSPTPMADDFPSACSSATTSSLFNDDDNKDDSAEMTALRRRTRQILKRITPRTFDRLSQEFLDLQTEMNTAEKVTIVIDEVFRKVCVEPRFSDMCGILCEMLSQTLSSKTTAQQPSAGDGGGGRIESFRTLALNKCYKIFDAWKNLEQLKTEKLKEIATITDEEKKIKTTSELERSLCVQKSEILGSINFIGHLCQRKLVSKFIAHFCVQHLLTRSTGDVDCVKCLCKFLTLVGKSLDEDKTTKGNVDLLMENLTQKLQSNAVPKRIQTDIRKLIELRNNNWINDSVHLEGETPIRTAECFVCFEEVDHEKFLSCGGSGKKHVLCENCIGAMVKNAPWSRVDKLVECPVCRSVTMIVGGAATKLKTKFFVDLMCDDCTTSDDIEERNWCKKCNVTLCSACVDKNHSSHDVTPWEDYEVAAECVSYLKKEKTDVRLGITKFCQQLNKVLLTKVDQAEKRASAFAASVENGFGPLPSVTSPPPTSDDVALEKKLKLVVQILKSRNFFANQDVDELIADAFDPVKLPPLEELVKIFQSK